MLRLKILVINCFIMRKILIWRGLWVSIDNWDLKKLNGFMIIMWFLVFVGILFWKMFFEILCWEFVIYYDYVFFV